MEADGSSVHRALAKLRALVSYRHRAIQVLMESEKPECARKSSRLPGLSV
jgi:hypothetical protein